MLRSPIFTIGVFALLFAIAIPWYWRFLPELAIRIVMGVPFWVLVSLIGSVAISSFTAWTFYSSWTIDEEGGDEC